MKKKLLWMLPAALTMVAAWLGAQSAPSRKGLAEITPGSALAFIEARNLSGILSAWDASAEKKTWVDVNHQLG